MCSLVSVSRFVVHQIYTCYLSQLSLKIWLLLRVKFIIVVVDEENSSSVQFHVRVNPILLEVAGVLAEGQVQRFQSIMVVFLGTEQQCQQVEGLDIIPTQW